MSYWVDQEYAERVIQFEPHYRKVSQSPFKLNCRCMICGDSATDPMKHRFWISDLGDGKLWVKCFNGGCYSNTFENFMKTYHPEMWPNLLMDRRKEKSFDTRFVKRDEPKIEKEKKIIEKLNFCQRLDTLPDNHPILKYTKSRAIPTDKLNRLWFTTDWQALCNSVNPDTYKKPRQEYRLVIPIFNKDGEIESFQGRALRKDAAQKYITIKACPDSTKIYGQDTVDPNKTVYFLEGPIDSLFIDNACAITGGNLALSVVPFPSTRVWALDHEPRHPDTVQRLKKLIDQGERVVMWDKSPWSSKDINEMILKDGATKEEIQEYMKNNIVQGLQAQLRYTNYIR